MNWNLAVEKNLEALRRILAMLVALVDVAAGEASDEITTRPTTLPRHLHRYVLRLLRPAESATRRLIIIAARGLQVELAPQHPRKPKPVPEPRTVLVLDRINGSIVSVPMVIPDPVPVRAPRPARTLSTPSLPLFDPLKRFGFRRRYARPGATPQIISFDRPYIQPIAARPPSPGDPLDAMRLLRRIEAIGCALDDLPGQAMRLARWRARSAAVARENSREAGEISAPQNAICGHGAARRSARRFQRSSPMRPGRPPGWRRKSTEDVDGVLNELHGLAVWARDLPDTS